jgi:Rap guanine nucleotide exchange factor 2
MFSIISGLSHGSVSRLKQTWERLPAKYLKLFKNLQDLMDPSRNMSKYRNLLNVQLTQCPAIPFFPIVKKDLTFIHLGNDTIVEGLINFEKMRMLAKEIQHVTNMAAPYYHKQNLESSPSVQPFSSANVPAFATLRKKKTTMANKRFEEEKIAVRAKKYLENLCVMYDEGKLNEMSCQLESSANSNAKKHDSSPLPTNSSNPLSDSRPASNTSKFGTDSNKAVQKLLGLTEKVKPHDQKKNPVPSMQLEHDLLLRRQPKKSKPRPLPAVRLSSESSSIAPPNVNKHIGSDHHQSASSILCSS